jgi:ABC-2 type transport system permease protein
MMQHAAIALYSIARRELIRFVQQRERMVVSILRPLLWMVIVGAGLRGSLQIEPQAPYAGVIDYQTYLLPGLLAMMLLFNGMQSALTMVFDREMGSMRLLLISPLPRWYLLLCKLLAAVAIALPQLLVFLLICVAFGMQISVYGALLALPAFIGGGLCCGALGLLLSSRVQQLENFAGVMNFVIFPLFFLSSALYPLSNFADTAPLLGQLAFFNPLTQISEWIRFALYGDFNAFAALYTMAACTVFAAVAIAGYRPSNSFRG